VSLRARFDDAATFREFVATAEKNQELWVIAARRAGVAPEAVARVAALPGRWHLLVLNEDWCGDSVNTLPYVARLAELAPNLELRVVGRDANSDLMDAHLTNGSRSIPAVIAYDDAFVERGWWGPRPAALQAWVLGPGWALDKAERYKEVRRWYARDGGRTTVEEIVAMLEAAARAAA
jgi:hypothetical protein